jgi:LacI family transcriptional regulator
LFLPAAQVALGAFGRLRRAGVRIPEDLALVGYENMVEADCLEVAITTVGIPALEMAQQVAATMMERLNGTRGPRRHVILGHRLTVRESCGARPRAAGPWKET